MRVAALTKAVGVMMFCGTAMAAAPYLVPDSTISIANVQTYCNYDQPFVRVDLLINAADVGRPGLLYVGSHNQTQTQAQFYTEAWQDWNGSLFPIHTIVRGGLTGTTLSIPLNDVLQKQGWKLYIGYGALSVADEMKVQRMLEALNKVKAKFPERNIQAVDPDHIRRVMIQDNMTRNVKYRYVRAWTPELTTLCDRGNH